MTSSALSADRAQETRQRYFAIDLAALRTDRVLKFDLYRESEGRLVLYRERLLPFTDECARRLGKEGTSQLFVDYGHREPFLLYMEEELTHLLVGDDVPTTVIANSLYVTGKAAVGGVFENPTSGAPIGRASQWVNQIIDRCADHPEAFLDLVRILDTDYELDSHSIHVCLYALGLARHVGVGDPQQLYALGMGALLHDIGKTRIDARIMRKRSPLSHAEFELMKKHVRYGAEILEKIPGLPREAHIAVMQHNEREDGSGYPRGLSGDQLHLFGRITAIADAFDAMTSHRVFHPAYSGYEAIREMLGQPLDQRLVWALIEILGPCSRG